MEQLMKVLLEDKEICEFDEIQQLYSDKDYESLYKNKQLRLEDIYYDFDKFIDDIIEETISIENLLVWFLNNKNLLLWLDWRGEGYSGEIADFVNEFMKSKFTIEVNLTNNFITEEDLSTKFNIINSELNKINFKLINIDTQSDEYYFTVVPTTINLSEINKTLNNILIYSIEDLNKNY